MKYNLECPICLDLLSNPVECKKCAGIMCQKCREDDGNLTCALCRSESECKPAINTVKFLDLLKFTCKNRNNGCINESVQSNIVDHIKYCQYLPQSEIFKQSQEKTNEINMLKSKYEEEIKNLKLKQQLEIDDLKNKIVIEKELNNGFGIKNQANGDKQIGELKDNKVEGYGIFLWKDGDIKMGQFNDQLELNGYGMENLKNMDSPFLLIGEYKNGINDGQGLHIDQDKNDISIGNLNNQELMGNGLQLQSNGNKNIGEFKQGNMNGHGVKYQDGNIQLGLFEDNDLKINQYTKYNGGSQKLTEKRIDKQFKIEKYSNQDTYIGEKENDKQNGLGKYIYKDGNTYFGQFKDNKFNGFGIKLEQNGDKFIGEYIDHVKKGYGINQKTNGEIQMGQFSDEKENNQFQFFKLENEDTYIGEKENDKQNGLGIQKWKKGKIYIGQFKDSKPNGFGIIIFTNGVKYVGEFKEGLIKGYGLTQKTNGEIEIGLFNSFKLDGQGIRIDRNESVSIGEFSNGALNVEWVKRII